MAGQYTSDVVQNGVSQWIDDIGLPDTNKGSAGARIKYIVGLKTQGHEISRQPDPAAGRRPSAPAAPERPVFSAIKLMEKDLGKTHISCDIGCHTFSALPPFNLGQTVLGYGLGLASSTGVAPNFDKRVISIMGDGGFWHNGLSTGVASSVFNKNDSILIVMKNGYTSATGWQWVPSTPKEGNFEQSHMSIEETVRALGVKWQRKVRTYNVSKMVKTLKEAMTTTQKGLKVIIAESECMLAKQRRVKAERTKLIREGKRAVRPALRHRRRCLHRRPQLHPPVGLPVAHHQGEPGPAAHRPDRPCQHRLRRLRPVRRGRPTRRSCARPSTRRRSSTTAGPFERWLAGVRQRVIGMVYSPEELRLAPRREGAMEQEDAAKAA